MTGQVLRIFGPALVWAVQFTGVYALISATCAPRALLEIEAMTAFAALLTGVAVIACLVFFVTAGRSLRRDRSAALAQAAWWSSLISLLAVLANAWPVAALTGCTG